MTATHATPTASATSTRRATATRTPLAERIKLILESAKDTDDALSQILATTKRRTDKQLFEALFGENYREVLTRTFVNEKFRAARAQKWNGKAQDPRTSPAVGRVGLLATAMKASWLEFRLPGGLKLGDAKRDEVADWSAWYLGKGRDMLRKSRWLGGHCCKCAGRQARARRARRCRSCHSARSGLMIYRAESWAIQRAIPICATPSLGTLFHVCGHVHSDTHDLAAADRPGKASLTAFSFNGAPSPDTLSEDSTHV